MSDPHAAAGPAPHLRPATDADVDAISAIWWAGWRDGHLGNVPGELLPHRGADEFRRRVPAQVPHTTVAELDGAVVGFVVVHDDEVDQMYVGASARGSGVADVLLRAAEAQIAAAGHAVAWLAVVPGNARARRFYERNGWADAGHLEHEAPAGDGTVVVPSRRYERPARPA